LAWHNDQIGSVQESEINFPDASGKFKPEKEQLVNEVKHLLEQENNA
jgi:hypothetical protein